MTHKAGKAVEMAEQAVIKTAVRWAKHYRVGTDRQFVNATVALREACDKLAKLRKAK